MDDEFAYDDWHVGQLFGAEAYADDEVDDNCESGEEECACHALAVEYEEEREVDECGASLLLAYDE